MNKSVTVYYSDSCLGHDMGPGHPECPERIAVIKQHLEQSNLSEAIRWLSAEPVSKEHLYLAHASEYVDQIFASAPTEEHLYLDPDTSMSPGSLEATLRATGAAINAVDMFTEGQSMPAFCLTRPPGHHAEAHRAMGFCIFNHVAIAACYALQKGYKRIAVADFDVHHGNGTEHILQSHPEILFLSSFQSPYYPFSGTGETPAHIINSPYVAGTGRAQFRELISSVWGPALTGFSPDILFISAGFDAHAQDGISQAYLTEEDYYWVSQKLQEWTIESTEGRVVSILEGGYNLSVLGPSVEAHLQGLLAVMADD